MSTPLVPTGQPTITWTTAPERSDAIATIVPAISTTASSAVVARATPSAGQAASWYLYQQSPDFPSYTSRFEMIVIDVVPSGIGNPHVDAGPLHILMVADGE